MLELYLRCPATDEPVYAGFQSSPSSRMAPHNLMEDWICPACGEKHEWATAAVWSAIPVTLSPDETAAFEMPSDATAYEVPSYEVPLYDVTLRKVA